MKRKGALFLLTEWTLWLAVPDNLFNIWPSWSPSVLSSLWRMVRSMEKQWHFLISDSIVGHGRSTAYWSLLWKENLALFKTLWMTFYNSLCKFSLLINSHVLWAVDSSTQRGCGAGFDCSYTDIKLANYINTINPNNELSREYWTFVLTYDIGESHDIVFGEW